MWKCIICDDEEMTRKGLAALTESSGLDIKVIGTASNGIDATNLILKEKPDIVLIDINMPQRDGLDVIETVRAEELSVQYIIISGYSDFNYAQRAIRLKVMDYLLKPITKKTLNDVLERCIHHLQERTLHSDITVPGRIESGIINEILLYIDENYTNPSFSLEEMAEYFCFSESYLSRLIKKDSGRSFNELLNSKRLEYAKKLLIEKPFLTIAAISDMAGYSSQHYFSRVFRAANDCTPVEYRKNNSVR